MQKQEDQWNVNNFCSQCCQFSDFVRFSDFLIPLETFSKPSNKISFLDKTYLHSETLPWRHKREFTDLYKYKYTVDQWTHLYEVI